MASDLDELSQRLSYLESKIKLLHEHVRSFISQSVLIQPIPSPDGSVSLTATLRDAPPISIRSESGTITNELRAILDALACQLAIRHSGKAAETYFPISKSQAIFNTDGRKKMRLLASDDQKQIEALRPWLGGHRTLFRLHEADRIRKHQRLLGFGNGGPIMRFGGSMRGSINMDTSDPEPLTAVGDSVTLVELKALKEISK